MKKDFSIQEYLSLGYIYLLMLGILSDSIYYHFIGINILEYSSILDVLISPIALLTEHYLIPMALVLVGGIAYLTLVKINPRIHQKFRMKRWYGKLYNVNKLDAKYNSNPSTNQLISLLAGFTLAFYLGMGLGRGSKQQKQMANNDIEVNHRIIFQDNSEEEVRIIGKNSLYLFYIPEGKTDIIISPIEYNVKKIIKLEEKE
ncbi:MAG: hypothetical protein AAF632_24050 [Bacteroidota bacterium]